MKKDSQHRKAEAEDEDEERHNKRIARLNQFLIGGVITIVSGAASFLGLWPSHHGWAIGLFAATLAGVGSVELLSHRFHIGWALAYCFVTGAIAQQVYMYHGPALPPEGPEYGWLRPAKDKFNLPCNPRNDPRTLFLVLGTNAIAMPGWMGRAQIITFEGRHILSVNRGADDEISINADLYDHTEEIAVHIERNQFRLIDGKYSYQKRSPDRSTLVVQDRKNKQLLYVRFANQRTMIIRANFYMAKGWKLTIDHKDIFASQDNKPGSSRISESCGAPIEFKRNNSLRIGWAGQSFR